MIAIIERKVSVSQDVYPPVMASIPKSRLRSGCSMALLKSSPGPLKIIKVTKIPTEVKARSFTTDSKAIAATRPSCLSVASMWRVPKRMENMAMIIATYNPVSFQNEVPDKVAEADSGYM